MKGLLGEVQVDARADVPEGDSLPPSTERAFQGLLVGVALGLLLWCGVVMLLMTL